MIRLSIALVLICSPLTVLPSFAQDDLEAISRFRRAAEMGGDAARGKSVFESTQAKCSNCHLVATAGRKAGPPLTTVGDKFTREQLITSVLEPSAMIHPDYGRVLVQTKNGKVIAGVLNKRTDAIVELFDADGKLQSIALTEIEQEKKGGPSMMPQGLQAAISTELFTDLIAYLESLKQIVPAGTQPVGLVDDIPLIGRPVQLEPLHTEEHRFAFPVCVHPIPGTDNEFVVVEQRSRKVWRLIKDAAGERKELFVDVSSESVTGEFEGLVCLVFHPKYLENGKYYLNYHIRDEGIFSPVIVERVASDDRRRDSGMPSRRLMRIRQDTDLHWGGMLAFGPDGYLYIGAGDGGPQEDPDGNGQNLKRWLGSILRIDVDHTANGLPYAIPATNPYANDKSALPEIWASGFRMPWRFSFDSKGDLWVGDIGQNLFEEITIARIGEDHGWNVFEGFANFSERYRRPIEYTPPVASYRRKHGVSVTGGYVYQGKKNPSFQGVYICGDFESKHLWALFQKNRQLIKMRQIGDSPERISSFGMDAEGELLVVGYAGTVYRLELGESVFE